MKRAGMLAIGGVFLLGGLLPARPATCPLPQPVGVRSAPAVGESAIPEGPCPVIAWGTALEGHAAERGCVNPAGSTADGAPAAPGPAKRPAARTTFR